MLTEETAQIRDIHRTPLGPMISTWTDIGLYSLRWDVSVDNQVSDFASLPDSRSRDLDNRLGDYFATGKADFESIKIDGSGWTAFSKQVYDCCRSIDSGTTLTYQELARRAGRALASRAVGAAMSRNRLLLIVPCHRVISAGGGLRGFSAPGGLATKRFLLDLEAK